MNRPVRTLYGLAAVGAATAVGITTQRLGFTVLTFFGTLWLPRLLGLPAARRHGLGPFCGGGWQARRGHLEDRLGAWHREAHGEPGAPPATSTTGAAMI